MSRIWRHPFLKTWSTLNVNWVCTVHTLLYDMLLVPWRYSELVVFTPNHHKSVWGNSFLFPYSYHSFLLSISLCLAANLSLSRPQPRAHAVPVPSPGWLTLTRPPKGSCLTEWNLLLKINFCQTLLHMNTASLWSLLWFLETNIGPTVAKSKGQFRTILSLNLWTGRHSQQIPWGLQRHSSPRESYLLHPHLPAPPCPTPTPLLPGANV